MTTIDIIEQDIKRYLFEAYILHFREDKKRGLSVTIMSPCKEPGTSAKIAERLATHLRDWYPKSIEQGKLKIKRYPFWMFEFQRDDWSFPSTIVFRDFPDDLVHFRKVHRKHYDIILMLDGYEYSHALGS